MAISIGSSVIIDNNRGISTTTLQNYSESIVTLGTLPADSVVNIGLSTGTVFTATLPTSGITTFTFTSGISTGAASFLIFLTNAGSGTTVTLSWPSTAGVSSVKWTGGTVPDRTTVASKTDIWSFNTLNNGVDWYGNIALFNFS